MYLNTLQDQFEIQKKALDALKRIRGSKIEESKARPVSRPKYELIFEEYSEDEFKQKMKYDMFIYDKLVEQVDESKVEDVQEEIVELYQYIRKIYEHINIKPQIYGPRNVIFESDEQYENNAARILNEYIDKNYYNLTNEEREARYKDKVIHEAKDYITLGGLDPQEAVAKAQKRLIYEQLLRRVAFPLNVESTITDLLESEEYALVFDQETLQNLYEAFQEKIKKISTHLV